MSVSVFVYNVTCCEQLKTAQAHPTQSHFLYTKEIKCFKYQLSIITFAT